MPKNDDAHFMFNMADHTFKVILVGQSGVGKTAIVRRYIKKRFVDKEQPTIGVDIGVKLVNIDGVKVKVCLVCFTNKLYETRITVDMNGTLYTRWNACSISPRYMAKSIIPRRTGADDGILGVLGK